MLLGRFEGEALPAMAVLVLDPANLGQHLVFAQEVIALGRPMVVALNMMDLADRNGLVVDPAVRALTSVDIRCGGWRAAAGFDKPFLSETRGTKDDGRQPQQGHADREPGR